MKKHLVLALTAVCLAVAPLAAKPTYPDATYPGTTYPEATYPEAAWPGDTYPEATYPEAAWPENAKPTAKADGLDAALNAQVMDAKRVIKVSVEDPSEDLKASCKAVLLNSKGDILLGSACSNVVQYVMQAAIGAPKSTQDNVFVSVKVDLSSFGKEFKAAESKAGVSSFTTERDYTLYRMKIRPTGKFAQTVKDLPAISVNAAKAKLSK